MANSQPVEWKITKRFMRLLQSEITRMLTKLLAINIVANNLSWSESKVIIALLVGVDDLRILSIWAGESEKSAVSEPEVSAEQHSRSTMSSMFHTNPHSNGLNVIMASR